MKISTVGMTQGRYALHRRRNRGAPGAHAPPLVRICSLVPPLKLSNIMTFLNGAVYSRNTCSDGSAIPDCFCHKEAQDNFKVGTVLI